MDLILDKPKDLKICAPVPTTFLFLFCSSGSPFSCESQYDLASLWLINTKTASSSFESLSSDFLIDHFFPTSLMPKVSCRTL